MPKRALITGITGQDGTYLAEYLIHAGYEVSGLVRGQQNPKLPIVQRALPELRIIEGDLVDQSSLTAALEASGAEEVYNLGAISYVPISWRQPTAASEITGLGVLRLLEAIRTVSGISPDRAKTRPDSSGIKMYQASTSEMFGKVVESPQNEETRFHPRSPYGVAKVYGHFMAQNYRESYGVFAASGILFNHESPRRGLEFVTRKVSMGVARIKLGISEILAMGNLDAYRDWGFAGDYVRAMHAMLQRDAPSDYVIGTGVTRSIRDLLKVSFSSVGLDWRQYVVDDPKLYRPAEVELLCADATKAQRELRWKPEKSFEAMIQEMVEADIRRLTGQARGLELLGFDAESGRRSKMVK